jgi:O-antigen/teichoic acid export membrane protein
MFSGMSQIQDDIPRIQRAFLSAIYHLAIVVIPASVLMIFLAEEITVLFLGDKYADAVPLVRILFVSVAFRSIIKIADSLVRAMDRVYTASAIKAVFLALVGFGTYYGLDFGLEGVAWSIVIAVTIQFYMIMSLSIRLSKLTWSKMTRKFVPGILIAFVVAIASSIALFVLPPDTSQLIQLGVSVVLVGIFIASVAWYAPFIFRQGKDNILAELADRLPFKSLKSRWKD